MLRIRSLAQHWMSGAMALAVVATALSTVTGATPSAQAQPARRPCFGRHIHHGHGVAGKPDARRCSRHVHGDHHAANGQHPGHRRHRDFLGRRRRARQFRSPRARRRSPPPRSRPVPTRSRRSSSIATGSALSISPEIAHQVDAVQTSTTSTTSTTTTTTTTTLPPTITTGTTTSTTTTTTTTTTSPGQAQTTTEMSSSANPSVVGQAVTFTATVTTVAGSGFLAVGVPLGGHATAGGRGWFGDVQRRRHGPGDGRCRGRAGDIHHLVTVSGCAYGHGDVQWHGNDGTEQRHDHPAGRRTGTADDATGLGTPGHPLVPPAISEHTPAVSQAIPQSVRGTRPRTCQSRRGAVDEHIAQDHSTPRRGRLRLAASARSKYDVKQQQTAARGHSSRRCTTRRPATTHFESQQP